ncbi:hypothetical protein FFI89_017605 [Bradyrhizobium sp. KBS0727]|uniref:hypothetical protein n=1 Tax=unclassified Bradyrhizobium TaxID=2631580 RepID=UPI00110D5BE2|nr:MULTISPECIES: hypothetical protein [unclassified Bradyrhizobium]QDW38801.1 hypothetical protein FFI71_017605 [Bradyrhizobium sp. KBS0725]QDW45404.1 hypothetical protein FFI89_017605 [Bradyrhizobium sp. KBS0727]
MSHSDPTDNALAAIASILDQPDIHREPVRPAVDERPVSPPPLPTSVEAQAPIQPHAPVDIHAPIEAHGYSRVGPGPMAALRFRWTVRADNGEYYVDETIGENSNPVVSGPMSRDAAVQMVHDREAEAHRRFEQLKSEMSGRGAAANLVRKDSGEA